MAMAFPITENGKTVTVHTECLCGDAKRGRLPSGMRGPILIKWG